MALKRTHRQFTRREASHANARSRKRKGAPQKNDCLDSLTEAESVVVLRTLLSMHPALRRDALHVAQSVLAGVSFECVAQDVLAAISALQLDDLRLGLRGMDTSSPRKQLGKPSEPPWRHISRISSAADVFDMSRKRSKSARASSCTIFHGWLLLLSALVVQGDTPFVWSASYHVSGSQPLHLIFVVDLRPCTLLRWPPRSPLRRVIPQHTLMVRAPPRPV